MIILNGDIADLRIHFTKTVVPLDEVLFKTYKVKETDMSVRALNVFDSIIEVHNDFDKVTYKLNPGEWIVVDGNGRVELMNHTEFRGIVEESVD